MACRIEYNSEGTPTRVLNKNGQDSNLFREIINHPMIDSFDDALSIYKNTETETFYQREQNYLFTNSVDGEVMSYREALQSGAKEIQLGFLDNSGNFTSLKTVRPNFDETTKKGFINSYIRQNLIAENKVLVDGVAYYQPDGYTQAAKGIKDMLVREQALVNLGWQNFQHTKNGFTFNETTYEPGFTEVENILTEEIRKVFETSSVSRENENTNKLDESELKLRLLDLLNNLGVQAMSISDYVSKYQTKNGIEPSARALADIANKIVAFQDGNITLEELSEETAHFIVEGWNQEEIENLLRNVHRTPEWQQFSEEYRRIYSDRYSGQELENAVRREILGKVLANSFTNNFSVENTQGTVTSIINRLRELFNNFIDYIRGNNSQRYREELNSFTDQVNDLLYESQLKDFINQENFDNNNFVLYKTGGEKTQLKGMRADIVKALQTVKQNIQKFSKSTNVSYADQASIDRNIRRLQELSDEASNLEQKQAIIEMLSVVDTQVRELNKIIDASQNDDSITFGVEENAKYENLTQNISELIGTVKNNIDNNPTEYPKKDWRQVSASIEEAQTSITNLQNKRANVTDSTIDKMVERVMLTHNLGEEYRGNVEAWLEAARADTSLFHRHFGQITNSRDPILGLMSHTLEKTYNGHNREYASSIKPFQQLMTRLGVSPADFKKFFNKGQLIDSVDHAEKERIYKNLRATSRLEALGIENPTQEQIDEVNEKAEAGTLEELSSEENGRYRRIYNMKRLQYEDRPFVEQYYIDEQLKYDEAYGRIVNGERLTYEQYLERYPNSTREEWVKFEGMGVSQATIDQRRAYSRERSNYVREAMREDGTIDYSRLSISSQEGLEGLKRRRQRDKSLTNSDGTLKTRLSATNSEANVPEGFLYVEQRGVFYYIDPNKTQDSEARIAIDLIKLDQRYRQEREAEGTTVNEVPESFINEVEEIERNQGKDAALKFLEANSSIFFGESFWNDMTQNQSYLDRVTDAADSLTPEDREKAYRVVDNLRQLNNRRASTIKQFQNNNRPYETDASKMGSLTKENLRELDEEIQAQYQELSHLITLENNTEEDSNPIYQSQPNEAYLGEVGEEQMTVQEEIEFIFKHSTSSAKDRVANFRRSLRRYLNGKQDNLTDLQSSFVQSAGGTVTQDNIDNIVRDYARTQLASYYKRLVPDEYLDVFATRETSSASNYLSALRNSQFIEVQPNYSFLEQEESKYKNPNYNPNYEGGIQPKKGMFESQEYKNLFAPDAQGNPTRNQNLFQALQELKTLHKQTLQNYGLEGNHSLFKVPQVTKKGVDRAVDIVRRLGRGGVRNSLQELFTYRVDDVEYGETITGTDINTVPTYYTRDVKNEAEVSDELFYTYALMHQQSILHKHRKKNIGEALAIKDALGKRDNVIGKDKEAKNTISMFKNFFDYGFLGKQETQEFKVNIFGKEMDLTKFARNLLDFIKFRNLGFSPIVAATSWFTGEVNLQIEKHVKEIINPSAERLGRKEFFKLATDAMKEVGNIQSNSKLNILGEYFGIYNLTERFENSNYGWFARQGTGIGWAVHQMANFPIVPRAMLAVLHDNRIVNGRVVNYNDFKGDLRTETPGLSAKEVESQWKQYEDNVIYNYIETTSDNQVRFTEGLNNELAEQYRTEEYSEILLDRLTTNIKRTASQLDQQIPESQKVAAQRHFAMNYLMTHRSWLSIAIANRTKNSHYNLTSGEFEEGSYRSFYKFIKDSLIDFTSNRNMKAFSNAWNGAGLKKDGDVPFERLLEVRRRNMRRVAVDSLWMMGVAAAAYALLNFSDDDEDNYALQLTSYLGLRTLNETVSSQTALPLQFYEVLKSPFVGLNTLKDLALLPANIFDSEEIKAGRYAGMTGRDRAFTKVTPGLKTAFDLYEIQNTKDTYWFYNSTNIMSSPVALLELAGLRED